MPNFLSLACFHPLTFPTESELELTGCWLVRSSRNTQPVHYLLFHSHHNLLLALMSLLTRLPRAAPALKRAYATVADASGVKVAGVESGAPAATSSVTVVVKAGSRFETKPGAAHVLKSFAFKVGLLWSGERMAAAVSRRTWERFDN